MTQQRREVIFLLTGMQILVMGGDARQLEVIRKLTELDAKVILVGFDQLAVVYPGAIHETLEEMHPSDISAILLPVAGAGTRGEIEAVFSNREIVLTEQFVQRTRPDCVIYSGISTDYLINLAQQTGRKLVNLMDRDDIAIYNSIPTAEGVLLLAIQNTDFTIHGSHVTILGLGRCGMTLARQFHALGANVKVGVRKSEQLARITEMGLMPFHLRDLEKEIEGTDICINTIPHPVVTANVLAKMPLHTFLIDIASKPGGTDFRYAEKRGIKSVLTPGLPGIVAPKTAGRILANVLSQLLAKEHTGGKGS